MADDRPERLDYFTRVIPMHQGAGGGVKSHQVAGAGSRFLAAATDLAIQLVMFAFMVWFVMRVWPGLIPATGRSWVVLLAFIEWHIIYFMLFECISGGTTPGKGAVGLRVVTRDGKPVRPVLLVVRNLMRVVDVVAACYLASLALVARSARHQRWGDMLAGTVVVYSAPLVSQLRHSRVPESLYSTSEDGYLLQAWMTRELSFDEESRMASAVDLAAYLHGKYDKDAMGKRDPVVYLRELYRDEAGTGEPEGPGAAVQN